MLLLGNALRSESESLYIQNILYNSFIGDFGEHKEKRIMEGGDLYMHQRNDNAMATKAIATEV